MEILVARPDELNFEEIKERQRLAFRVERREYSECILKASDFDSQCDD